MKQKHGEEWAQMNVELSTINCFQDFQGPGSLMKKRKASNGKISLMASISSEEYTGAYTLDRKIATKGAQRRFEYMIAYWVAKNMRPLSTTEDSALSKAVVYA